MVFRRARRWSVTGLVLGALLVAGTLVSPAEAITKRTVSFRTGASTALAGTQITVAGTISKAPKGTYVYIQRFNGDYWQIAALASTTDTGGDYRTKLTLPKQAGTSAYRAYVPPSSTLSAATSGTLRVTALRKVYTSLKASATTVSLGKQAKLLGKVSPYLAGTKVTVERYNGIAWKYFATKSLSGTGAFTHAFYPKATMSYRFKVPRTGLRAAATSAPLRVTVSGGEAPPTITTTTLPGGQTGASYYQTLTKAGGSGTWSLLSGSLPAGLALKSVSGVIAGTPTKAGTSGFRLAFTSSAGPATAKSLSITVSTGPVITTSSLPAGSRGTAYSATLTKTGKTGSWSLTGGALPAGITLDTATGVLSGTPTQDGTFPVTFTYTETAAGLAASKGFQLVIVDPPDPVITTTSLPEGVVSQAYGPVTLQKTGNSGTWAVTAGALPTGLALSSSGVLSGTPSQAGDFFPTVTFTEANGTTDSQSLVLHVSAQGAPVLGPPSLADGLVGGSYEAQLTASVALGSWSITWGALPPGLSMNSSGAISGTPTTAGDYQFIVSYVSIFGSNTKPFWIHVDPA